jgi:hypothetical protein
MDPRLPSRDKNINVFNADGIMAKEKMRAEVDAWQNNRNSTYSRIDWQFACKDARIKLKRLYPTLDT